MNLSYSKLSTFFACPYQYWCKYEAPKEIKAEEKDTVARLFGIAVHQTLEDTDSTSVEELYSVFQKLFLPQLENENLMIKPRDNIASELKRAKKLLANYVNLLPELSGDKKPKKEWWFKFNYHGYRLVGKIDYIQGFRLCDWKTGKYEPRLDELPHSLQFAMYRLGFIDSFGIEPELYYVSLNGGKVYPVHLVENLRKEPTQVAELLAYTEQHIDSCKAAGYFPPTAKYGFSISCNNCGFRHICMG